MHSRQDKHFFTPRSSDATFSKQQQKDDDQQRKHQQAKTLKSLISAFRISFKEIFEATIYVPNLLTNVCETTSYFGKGEIKIYKEVLNEILSGKVSKMKFFIAFNLPELLIRSEHRRIFTLILLDEISSNEIEKSRASFESFSALLRKHETSLTSLLNQYFKEHSQKSETEKSTSLIKAVQTNNLNLFQLIFPQCNQSELEHALKTLDPNNTKNHPHSFTFMIRNCINELMDSKASETLSGANLCEYK